MAIPCRWDGTDDCGNTGLAFVEMQEKRGIIDRQGQLRIPCIWGSLEWNRAHSSAPPTDYLEARGTPPWRDRNAMSWLLTKSGLAGTPWFPDKVEAFYDREGRLIWRSDLHALRPALPHLAAVSLLLAAGCLWRARPNARRQLSALQRQRPGRNS